MRSAVREAIAPLYLFACLIIGGSAQGIWLNAVLQVAGVAIIAWAATSYKGRAIAPDAPPILILAAIAIAIVMLQCIPLPPSLWAHGVRARLATDYAILGQATPWLPVSLTPFASLDELLGIIPPLALFCSMVCLHAYRSGWLIVALVVGTLAGVSLGILQVGTGPRSPWYLFPETNFGSAVGFFANANHMATLLLITIPFVLAAPAAARGASKQSYSATLALSVLLIFLLVVGIALNGSWAGYVLAAPVLAASTLVTLPPKNRFRVLVLALAALSAIAAIAALSTTAMRSNRAERAATTAVQSREVILGTTTEAIRDYMPFGSGLGSFVPVYRTYESPDSVTSEYVIHAHDDYAELALELGVPGIVLMLAFIGWWIRVARSVWVRGEGGPFARAACVASAAVLVHSTVDFPLRTAAIGACFAMCLAFMADRKRAPRVSPDDLRPTRHLVFE